jgi:hypothetical protein
MSRAKVVFYSVEQKTQHIGNPDLRKDHMVSVISFDLEVDGKKYRMSVEVRQPYGTDFESEPIEVRHPDGEHRGAWNQRAFAERCEQYYRSQIGSTGMAFRVSGGSTIMQGNFSYSGPVVGEFDIPESGAMAWQGKD